MGGLHMDFGGMGRGTKAPPTLRPSPFNLVPLDHRSKVPDHFLQTLANLA